MGAPSSLFLIEAWPQTSVVRLVHACLWRLSIYLWHGAGDDASCSECNFGVFMPKRRPTPRTHTPTRSAANPFIHQAPQVSENNTSTHI